MDFGRVDIVFHYREVVGPANTVEGRLGLAVYCGAEIVIAARSSTSRIFVREGRRDIACEE